MPSQFLEQRSSQCVPCCLDKQGTEGHCPEKRARSIPSEQGAHHAATGSSANDPVSLFLSLGLQLADLSFNLTSAPRTQMHISALRHLPPRNAIRHLSPGPCWHGPRPPTNITSNLSAGSPAHSFPTPGSRIILPATDMLLWPSMRALDTRAVEFHFSEWFKNEHSPGIQKYERPQIIVVIPNCRSFPLLICPVLLILFQFSSQETSSHSLLPGSNRAVQWAQLPEFWSDSLELALGTVFLSR